MQDKSLFLAATSLCLFEMFCQSINRTPTNLAYFAVVFAAISVKFLVFDLRKGE